MLNNIFRSFGLVMLGAFLVGCQSNDNSVENKQIIANKNQKVLSVKNDKMFADAQISQIYEQYLMLSNCLVESDYIAAKEYSLILKIATKQYLVSKKLSVFAEKMLEAKDVSALRNAYASFSEELISLIKVRKIGGAAVYLTHCPMALDDKGANWISAKKEVRNPYFGDEMLDCGEVTEELK